MKNKIITGIALCSLFITGCSLDKAYLNRPNASTYPATKSEEEAGLYATDKGLTLIDASSTPFPGIQDNASDIGASRINAANYNYQQQSKLPPSNAWVTKVYTQIYKTAARANLVLDGIDNVRELMSEQKSRARADALKKRHNEDLSVYDDFKKTLVSPIDFLGYTDMSARPNENDIKQKDKTSLPAVPFPPRPF